MARAGSSDTDGRPPAWFLAVLVLAVAPLFVAVGMQAHRGWRPVSDDAAVATLAHDVLSTRTPLVGMPSTIGKDAPGGANEHAHHPGPMMFWALAVPERLAGSAPIGILIGTALVNAAALLVVGLLVARVLGRRAAAGTLALLAVLVWALGRQWIVDPWNPYLALLPVFALCTLAWVAAAGRPRALVGVAIVGSFVAQTHLIYAPLAAAMLALAGAGVALTLWNRARRGEAWRREALITSGITMAALVVAWALPIYDQLAHSPGNLSAVASSFGGVQGRLVGLDWTLRLDVQAVGLPPLFARQGAGVGVVTTRSWSSLGPLRVGSAIAVVLTLVVSLAFAVRRRDRIVAAAAGTALAALATATVVVSRVPGYFGGAPPFYRILQVWPIGCFVWFALAVSVSRALAPYAGRRLGGRLSSVRGSAFAVSVVVLSVVPVAVAFADSATRDDTRAEDAVGRLAAQLQPRLDPGVPYEVDVRTDKIFIGGAVQSGLFRELARRGFDTRVDRSDDYLGRAHAAPRDATHLVVCAGRRIDPPVGTGVERVGQVILATTADVDRMRGLDTRLHDFVAEPANLTTRGRTMLESASSEPDALVLQRLLDPANDRELANDGLIAIARNLISSGDRDFVRLLIDDANVHVLVDDYAFSVYLVPPS